ncbi:NAD(P)-dependent dehydrogenase (short-subunit alcohol dehydrogenase family) [Streptomyces canus]|nr:NAD(P)-dependent dehydrogenase (short-subunit alcohol dehydrogenase family) [Streptomyces canus]
MTVSNATCTGKVAFVTGAGSGIGRTTAVAFARAGARVALADLSADGLRETARLVEEAGGRALALTRDVTSEDDVTSALGDTVQAFGRLDAAFNNAGVEQPVTPAADIAKDEWDRVVGVSLTGMSLCMKHQIPLMLRQGEARSSTPRQAPASRVSRDRRPTPRPSTASSARPAPSPSTARHPTSASTPCAPASSTPR